MTLPPLPPPPSATPKQKQAATRRGTNAAAHPAAKVETSAAYDGGNSGSTLVLGEALNVVSQPSAIYPCGDITSALTYEDGSGSTLLIDGRYVYTGKAAIEVGKSSVQWTGGNSNRNKPEFARYLMPALAAAAHSKAREIDLTLYSNVHQSSLIEPMSQALMGEHAFSVLDSDTVEGVTKRDVLVRVHLEKVLLEEIGAIVNASSLCHAGSNTPLLNPKKANAVLGFGGKTFNVAIFQGTRAILEPQALEIGGWDLIRAISRQDSLKRRLEAARYPQVGDVSVSHIKDGLESGTFVVGSTGVTFRPEFDQLLEPVLVRPALDYASQLVKPSNVENILVSGGCSLAPGLVELVAGRFPKVVTTGMGSIDNARGLAIRAAVVRRRRMGTVA